MFCVNCGCRLEEGTKFCPSCGKAVSTGDGQTPPNIPDAQYAQTNFTGGAPAAPAYAPAPPQPKLKWFKFIIYVQLFLAVLVNFVAAITYLTGSVYASSGVSAKIIYAFYPGLHTLDIIYGLLLVVSAAAAIAIRMKLAKYKKGAPSLYMTYIITVQCLSLLYVIILGTITNSWDTLGFQIGMIIGSGIYVALNAVYFSKRSELFVN